MANIKTKSGDWFIMADYNRGRGSTNSLVVEVIHVDERPEVPNPILVRLPDGQRISFKPDGKPFMTEAHEGMWLQGKPLRKVPDLEAFIQERIAGLVELSKNDHIPIQADILRRQVDNLTYWPHYPQVRENEVIWFLNDALNHYLNRRRP